MNTRNTVLALFAGITLFSACKDGDESNMQYIEQLKDSVLAYPSVYSVTIEVKHSSILDVTLGSAKLYEASDAERQKIANEIGMLAFRVFPKDNSLEKGEVHVSKDEKSVTVDPATTKNSTVNMDSLRIILAKREK